MVGKWGLALMYCPGNCKHLDEKRSKCILTGKPLARATVSALGMRYTVHEHEGVCEEAEEKEK